MCYITSRLCELILDLSGIIPRCVIDIVGVFLPKCPLTTVRSRFSADELQLVRGEAYEYVHVDISPMLFCVDVLLTQYF